MSSLHCAARVFVARNGEAEYETDLRGDDGGSLTALGRRQARDLADRLAGERIARVWTSPLSRAVQSAEIAASRLEVGVTVREGLQHGAGELAARVAEVLDEVADHHPGEAALVVSHGGAIVAALPQLVGLPRARNLDVPLAHGAVAELEKDADGWRLVRWDLDHR